MPATQPFVREVTQFRDEARSNMEEGAASGDAADTERLIDVLNDVVATEAACYVRYRNYAVAAAEGEHVRIAAEFAELAALELQHFVRASERVNQLGGTTVCEPLSVAQAQSENASPPAFDITTALQENLMAECIVSESYHEVIRWIGDTDPISRDVMRSLLADEEDLVLI